MGKREIIADVARNLSRLSAMIVARLDSHARVEELARWSSVPVINALTDLEHPCQALADLLTIEEWFGEEKLKLVWIGDGNNVANSFAVTAAKMGHDVAICAPEKYRCAPYVYEYPNVIHEPDPQEALAGANVVYTDVWVSMGQEADAVKKVSDFEPYQVNTETFALAERSAIFMHCLPARRGLEVTDEVIDGPRSVVFCQAENRFHAQKALMKLLLEGCLA